LPPPPAPLPPPRAAFKFPVKPFASSCFSSFFQALAFLCYFFDGDHCRGQFFFWPVDAFSRSFCLFSPPFEFFCILEKRLFSLLSPQFDVYSPFGFFFFLSLDSCLVFPHIDKGLFPFNCPLVSSPFLFSYGHCFPFFEGPWIPFDLFPGSQIF